MKKSITEKINDAVVTYIFEAGRHPSRIILHPRDYERLLSVREALEDEDTNLESIPHMYKGYELSVGMDNEILVY